MFTTALFTIAQMSINRLVGKQNIMCAFNYTQPYTWMSHENMLSKRSQTQKDNYCMIPLLETITMLKFMETEGRISVYQGLAGWVLGSYCFGFLLLFGTGD